MLDGLMFYHMLFSPFAVAVVCVRSKASICPRMLYGVVRNVVFKGGVFEFIGLGITKNWIVLCELFQD